MWNHLAESVAGTSHFVSGTPCQDAHEVHLLDEGENQLFAFAIADGAGSADHSGEAARLAVSSFIQEISKPHRDRFFVEEAVAREMFDLVRQKLLSHADALRCPVRELSCTLLGGLASNKEAWFAQIGDGACVYANTEGYHLATVPVCGEFVNQTVFVVSEDWKESFQFRSVPGPISGVAGFTDGLQNLIIRFADNSVHEGFMDPILQKLRMHDALDLQEAFRSFMKSERINSRTDDDKTLVIACWRGHGDPSDLDIGDASSVKA
jgi:hypothetical protein